jgi:hypothetical protein
LNASHPDGRQGRIDSCDVIEIAGDHGVSTFPGAQRNMHINDIVMAGGRTHESNASGSVQIQDSDLSLERLDQTR